MIVQEGYSSEEAGGILKVGGVSIRCNAEGQVRHVRQRGHLCGNAEARQVAQPMSPSSRRARSLGLRVALVKPDVVGVLERVDTDSLPYAGTYSGGYVCTMRSAMPAIPPKLIT